MEKSAAAREPAPFSPLPMKPPRPGCRRREDGSILLWDQRSPGRRPRSVPHLLDEKAALHPDRPWICERQPGNGAWRTLTYGEASRASGAAAGRLQALGLGPERPLMILSGNSIEHAVLTVAAMKIRAPVAPLSTAYATVSRDFSRLQRCFESVRPGALFVQAHEPFARALEALPHHDVSILSGEVPPRGCGGLAEALFGGRAPSTVDGEMERIQDETVAKLLFTSGSTGHPKAVPQTQGMLCEQIAAQDAIAVADPGGPDHVAKWLEWMPWSHVSAGNVGFNAVLWAGATLYLDDGRPIPGAFDRTIRNLREVSPDMFGTAPIAYAMLADAMERDAELRRAFFRNLRFLGYGGAALADDLYQRLQALALAETGRRIPFSSMYGATETQGVAVVNWEVDRVGLIGLPLPGVTFKLVPFGTRRFELRVKGPTVALGYHGDPERSAAAFDEEGFYRIGDAVRFVDEADPAEGLIFDGRVTEEFKLASGTWVAAGALRADLVSACAPLVAEAVIAGQDKPFASALVWLSAAAAEQDSADVREQLRGMLVAFNARQGGSSRRIARVRILTQPPSPELGELTDKGSVNQRVVLATRSADAAALYAPTVTDDMIVVD